MYVINLDQEKDTIEKKRKENNISSIYMRVKLSRLFFN